VLGTSTDLSKCTLQVDWAMPNRLTEAKFDSWGRDQYGLPPRSYVDPPNWKVTLIVSGHDACSPGVTYDWDVKGEGWSEYLSGTGCSADTTVPKLGTYDVRAIQHKHGATTGYAGENGQVVVQDWLIVGLGDSNGSGEGDGPPWEYYACSRSAGSNQYQTAQYVENQVQPHASVTLVLASCSGAKTFNVDSEYYAGTHPAAATSNLPPQLDQVGAVIGSRKLNAVVMSIGVNDIGFGPMMGFCVALDLADDFTKAEGADTPCQQVGVLQRISGDKAAGTWPTYAYYPDPQSNISLNGATVQLLQGLPNAYAGLAIALKKLAPQHVFITDYPDFSRNQDGNLCGTTKLQGLWFPNFTASVWGWLEQVGQSLNSDVNSMAGYGWTPITGVPTAFQDHGYCALVGDDFVPMPKALLTLQDPATADVEGTFHPTDAGQTLTAKQTEPSVCQALYGNPTCTGLPPAQS
jgi:hypothetical protein